MASPLSMPCSSSTKTWNYTIAWSTPRNQSEADLVFDLATARLRLRRVWDIETALIDPEIRTNAKSFESQSPASRSIIASGALTLLNRYDPHPNQAHRALRSLQLLRSVKVDVPNEPEPVISAEPPGSATNTCRALSLITLGSRS